MMLFGSVEDLRLECGEDKLTGVVWGDLLRVRSIGRHVQKRRQVFRKKSDGSACRSRRDPTCMYRELNTGRREENESGVGEKGPLSYCLLER